MSTRALPPPIYLISSPFGSIIICHKDIQGLAILSLCGIIEKPKTTFYFFCITIDVICFVSLSNAVSSHARKLIFVTIATLPREMDRVPERESAREMPSE